MRNSAITLARKMADWSVLTHEWPPDWPAAEAGSYGGYGVSPFYPEKPPASQCLTPQAQQYLPPASPTLTLLLSPQSQRPRPCPSHYTESASLPRGENPRELRNKAEKQRRDKLNQSISQLASMVPPVASANRKFDKTSVLRLTAHYLRAHQYVFGAALSRAAPALEVSPGAANVLLSLLNGFLLTTTYRGLVVVVSQNVQQHLGYAELDLLGQSIFKITHPDDYQLLKEQLMPKSSFLGPHGELLLPNDLDAKEKVIEELAKEKRKFTVRFKKISQRSEPAQYVTCVIEGSMRKSDGACQGYNRCCQMVRRTRARGDNPYSSGNDIVFIGVVRPTSETFISERILESFKMEYRTRHSVDGEIIQCEQRIALVTGYMTHEVNGLNALNFMHRDDVRWVIFALRQMYDQHLMMGESCYRLMAKNGQFIYLRTRGWLDVEDDSRAVRSFVCTNTVVDEREGKHLIKMMKRKFMRMINSTEEIFYEEEEATENQAVPVEDPRNLEKVILHLVTDLPSPQGEREPSEAPESCTPALPLAIIPPRKERIVSAIEKIYNIFKNFHKDTPITCKTTAMDNGAKMGSLPTQEQTTELPKNQTEPRRSLSIQTEFPTAIGLFEQSDAGASCYLFNNNFSEAASSTSTSRSTSTSTHYHGLLVRQNAMEHFSSEDPQPGPSGLKRACDQSYGPDSKRQKSFGSDRPCAPRNFELDSDDDDDDDSFMIIDPHHQSPVQFHHEPQLDVAHPQPDYHAHQIEIPDFDKDFIDDEDATKTSSANDDISGPLTETEEIIFINAYTAEIKIDNDENSPSANEIAAGLDVFENTNGDADI